MSDGLRALRELAERQRDAARTALMQAEAMSNRALAQLDQLRAYEADYLGRAPGLAGAAAPIELVLCHQGFMDRLQEALAQQRDAVDRAHAELVRRRQLLQDAELKRAAVQKLMERRQAERHRIESQREQRQADERAQHRHRRATTNFGGWH